MKSSMHIKKIFTYILSILFIYLIWLLYSLYVNNSLVFPSPNKVLIKFFQLLIEKDTYIVLFWTFTRFITALILSFLIGLILGILAGFFKWLENFLHPIITILRSLPLASIVVLIMVLIGLSNSPMIITSIMLIPIIYQAVLNGVKNIDPDLTDVWKLDSNLNILVIRKVIIPQSKPFIKTALSQSIGLGYKVLIMAEFICQTSNSIGKSLVTAKNNIQYGEVMAWSIILIAIVIILEKVIIRKNNFE